MASLSTHVLDSAAGQGSPGVAARVADAEGHVVGSAETDADGRIAALATDLPTGLYRVTWDRPPGGFLREVSVVVDLAEDRHYHVPLLASAASGTVYLGV